MTNAVTDLTEKEKEALRLLTQGHDAKSSASLLDISVHTINDRLRNARRKLNVSSSREAARILRVAEDNAGPKPTNAPTNSPQNAPESVMHTSLGITDAAPTADNGAIVQHSPKGASRVLWLAGGMLIMSLLIAAAVFALVSTSSEATTATAPSASAPTATASQAEVLSNLGTQRDAKSYAVAVRFLAEVDAGDWEGSWDVAGDFIQKQVSAEQWTATVKPVREPLGKVQARELTNVQKTDTLPNAPAGEYEILQFATAFEGSEAGLTETVIMIKTDDGFDVAGFFIR